MGIIVILVVIIIGVSFVIGVISAAWNEKKSADMDEFGNLHCKMCGCSQFVYDTNAKGVVTTRCVKCGYSWKTR